MLGGMLATCKIDNNAYVDRVYRHIFPQNQALLSFIAKLGLTNEIVWRKNQTGIIIDSKPLPLNFFSDLSRIDNLSFIDKYKFIIFLLRSLLINNWREMDAISTRELVESNCGAEIWKKIFYPPLKAKFCNFADNISAAWFYKKLQQRVKCRTIRSGEKLGAFERSSKILVDCISEKIREKGGMIFTEARVERIKIKDLRFEGLSVNKKYYSFDSLIATTPTPELVNLFPSDFPDAYDSIRSLKNIEHVHSLCTLIRLKKKLSKFYWLFVHDEQSPFFLIVEHTNLIDPESCNGEHVVYLARYVASQEELYSKSDKEIFDSDFFHLKMIFPHINDDDIIDYTITRIPYAQPIFKRHFLNSMSVSKFPVKGMYVVNTSQLFPLERTVNDHLILAKQCVDKYY